MSMEYKSLTQAVKDQVASDEWQSFLREKGGAIPCTSCGALVYKEWTRAFKPDVDGTMQAYHLRCVNETECPECEHELPEGATKCPTCSGSDYL